MSVQNEVHLKRQKAKEQEICEKAKKLQKNISFIAEDGCEVTATSTGHIFYNAADWW